MAPSGRGLHWPPPPTSRHPLPAEAATSPSTASPWPPHLWKVDFASVKVPPLLGTGSSPSFPTFHLSAREAELWGGKDG